MKNNVMVFLGHHKCASTYINQVIAYLCALLGVRRKVEYHSTVLPMNYHLVEPFKTDLPNIMRSIHNDDYDFLCHWNADLNVIKALRERGYKGFHVIRDPRDVVISGYFSHKFSHPAREDLNPWMVKQRELLTHVDLEEGLLLEIAFNEAVFEAMRTWNYNDPKVYESRYETLTVQPQQEFKRIFEFLGIAVPDFDVFSMAGLMLNKLEQKLLGHPMRPRNRCPKFFFQRILSVNSFETYAKGRKKGEEDAQSHFRKGVAGDWKNHFTPKVKDVFKERYGQLLIDLKYENSLDW
jgi:hypothetical protein